MSSTVYCLTPALYGILATLFLGLAIYSLIFGLKLPKIKEGDLAAVNEFGRAIFHSKKLEAFLVKLPKLLYVISLTSFIGFILSTIALAIQVWQ